MNTAALPFTAAGAAARVSELGRAGELAQAADTSRAAQVVKTLFRPQPQERSISAQFGEGSTPMTLHPAAYKSALGGYLQTKVLDPLLEKHLTSPNPYNRSVAQAVGKTLNVGSRGPVGESIYSTPTASGAAHALGPASRFGRKARADLNSDIRIRSKVLEAKGLPPDSALAKARGTAFVDRWSQLHAAGATHDEAVQQPWRDWTPIKAPPASLTLKGKDFSSESQLHDYFTSPGKMIPSRAEYEKNPEAFSHVPSDLLKSIAPGKPSTGPGATLANAVDKGTQLIRSGRFLTPAYAQWAAQNGLIHASQAGAMIFRNMWQLRSEFPKAKDTTQAAIDGAMGRGVSKATAGERELGSTPVDAGTLKGRISQRVGNVVAGDKMKAIQSVWHTINDQWARRMAAIHELNAYGYHSAASWDRLLREDPSKFRMIVAGQGNREAINYEEMTPAEHAIFSKTFTAYGWTRGASTYAGRFALQHPIQARVVGGELGTEGNKSVEDYYSKLQGMVPDWLRQYMPLGGGKLLDTAALNPGGTAGSIIGELPGVTAGQTENIMGEAAPVPTAAMELATGTDKYGAAYKGSSRLTAPVGEALGRFKPLGVIKTLQGKKGGTFVSGRIPGLEQLAGSPVSTLRNPKQTAALGLKDYEASLQKPDLLSFRLQRDLSLIPQQVRQYEKVTGSALPADFVQHLQGDLQAVHNQQLFEYNYANSHNAKAWKSLPAQNKLAGTLAFMTQHHFLTQPQAQQYLKSASTLTTEKDLETFVSQLWSSTGIGAVSREWKSAMKQVTPNPKVAANP